MENISLLTDEALITGAELLEHPEWNPCELIRGKVKLMSPAGGKHGVVALRIGAAIDGFVRAHKLGVVFAAETGFYIGRDPDTVRAPDVSFLAHDRIPLGGIPDEFIPIVPDLAVEVLSPPDTWKELDQKAAEYLHAGVRLVWGVDSRKQNVRVYRSGRAVLDFENAQTLSGEDVLPGFELKLKDIF